VLSLANFHVAGEALHPPDGSEERTIRRQRQLLAHQQARECAVGVEQGTQLFHKPNLLLLVSQRTLATECASFAMFAEQGDKRPPESMQVKEVKVSAQAMLPSSSVITFTLGALSVLLQLVPSSVG
jgi:hypothetical protein